MNMYKIVPCPACGGELETTEIRGEKYLACANCCMTFTEDQLMEELRKEG